LFAPRAPIRLYVGGEGIVAYVLVMDGEVESNIGFADPRRHGRVDGGLM
jgi:hypothetical protein